MTFPDLPTPREFFTDAPLYLRYDVSDKKVWAGLDLIYYGGTYDSLCIECGRESTFQVTTPNRPDELTKERHATVTRLNHGVPPRPPRLESDHHIVVAHCSRFARHTQRFVLLVSYISTGPDVPPTVVLEKIGQHPQLADLTRVEHRDYARVMSPSQRLELNRAMGLAAHGVGVGSFVYLRRIFEGLVEDAHQVARSEVSGWDEKAYSVLKMHERISALRDYLPAFLVEHPSMYSLLSKGIHELTEEDCLAHFDALKVGVELMLDQKLEAKQRAERTLKARSAMAKALKDAGGAGAD